MAYKGDEWFTMAIDGVEIGDKILLFKENLYEGKLKEIGQNLSSLIIQEGWSNKTFLKIRHQSYQYFLKDGFLWKRSKRKDGISLGVVDDLAT